MSMPGGYQAPYLVSPAFAVTPFVTVQGVLIGNDAVTILPASIYPRNLLGINYNGPSSASSFEVYLGSPTNLIDSTTTTGNGLRQYNTPFSIPPNTQVFCFWRNAAAIIPVAATLLEVVGAVGLGTTQSVSTAGSVPGDTLYCWHHDNFLNTNGELVNMTAPSGTLGTGAWSPIINTAMGAGGCGGRLWQATTIASGAHLVTSNQLDGASSNALIVARMRNISFIASAVGGQRNPGAIGSGTCPDIPGGVTQQAQDTVFRLYGFNSGAGAPVPGWNLPAGYTLQKENIRNATTDQALFSEVMAVGAPSIGALTTGNVQTIGDGTETISFLVRGISSATSTESNVTFQMSAGS